MVLNENLFIHFSFFEQGLDALVQQAGFELRNPWQSGTGSDPLSSASPSDGITGVHHHAWLKFSSKTSINDQKSSVKIKGETHA